MNFERHNLAGGSALSADVLACVTVAAVGPLADVVQALDAGGVGRATDHCWILSWITVLMLSFNCRCLVQCGLNSVIVTLSVEYVWLKT